MTRIPVFVALPVAVAVLAAAPASLARSGAMNVTNVNVIAGKPSEFGFKLSTKTVKHGVIVFKVINQGQLPHTFKMCSRRNKPLANSCTGRSTKQINPGQSTTLRVSILLERHLRVPLHRARTRRGRDEGLAQSNLIPAGRPLASLGGRPRRPARRLRAALLRAPSRRNARVRSCHGFARTSCGYPISTTNVRSRCGRRSRARSCAPRAIARHRS